MNQLLGFSGRELASSDCTAVLALTRFFISLIFNIVHPFYVSPCWVASSVKAGLYLPFLLYIMTIGAQDALCRILYSPFFPNSYLSILSQGPPDVRHGNQPIWDVVFFLFLHPCFIGVLREMSSSYPAEVIQRLPPCDPGKSNFLSRYSYLEDTIHEKDYRIKNYYFLGSRI